ncbi:septum formation family protein [Cellulomonas sp. S1-8]|uniref:septum formation family protein n=1 Tax=Cellulomonas sp. S1-8 TaxID=2904790 RepID=UPI00224346C5|nr:septum formation family protein [Cellulomonas sp. S1-8]UZN03938.1 septum formation family protein [Cellulomonas sp. S1-8]
MAGAGAVVVLAALAVVGTRTLSDYRSRPLAPDVAQPVEAYAVQLVTGSCLEALPADGEVGRVGVVPCADPHAAQVVAQYAFDAAAAWPGQDGAHQRVTRACVLSDEEVAAGVRLVTWAPSEAGWSRGDRTGLCLAVPTGPVTGSFVDGTATPAGESPTPAG